MTWATSQGWKHLLLLGFGFVMIYPLIWMFVKSLTPSATLDAALSFDGLTFENYIEGWTSLTVPFGRFMANSMLVAVLCIVGNLASCTLAAYAFARLQFRLRGPLFGLMLATIMLPFHVTIVPQYILFHTLGWINTYVPLVLPKFLAVESFFVFLMVQFIRGIPRTLDDAAALDGCGPFRTFFRVILPLCIPAIGVTTVFTFIWTWNDFFTPLLYLSKPDLYTVPVGLSTFQDSTGLSNYGALFAMSILSLVPVFIVFLFAQRALTRGIATTGIK
ncbi:binding-protein-dependent transport systems inner membrane component [Beutenbergia cavernae DSM 12333]|uniref:Binding-protein-dependent transport systems inner membrane component n=1 Tax=Beutenbergia cavernae (strain ATCC BAA-8 / DSM 12333 / CCUG 43141 / JCM 11478 / NBRC 16432 / NCIMB 13614 / HKI 0122) TaxID=471853 RepID=C5C2V2_BEUC1|nr:carbohydrate ABC transporter permease [Beutenbergia cavernae]ACQ81796.1 binding-protein-dependent transport systems inner membrane component [Beutenbergia cavernae DSM 12333]